MSLGLKAGASVSFRSAAVAGAASRAGLGFLLGGPAQRYASLHGASR